MSTESANSEREPQPSRMPRRRGRLSRALGVQVAVAIVIGSVAGAATALNSPDDLMPTATYSSWCYKGQLGNANPCQTDNAYLGYYMDSADPHKLESADRQAVTNVLTGMYASTVFTVVYDSSPTFSGSAETDIVYQEGTVPGSDNGYTWCDDPSTAYGCDQQYVWIESGYWTQGIVCHETGHAVGLTHGSQAYPVTANNSSILHCMRKPTPVDADLGSNNKDNINSVY